MEPKNGFTNRLPCFFLSAHRGFFWLLLRLAIAGAVWFLAGIVRVVRSEEFRAKTDRLRSERRSKRGKHLLGLLVLVALLRGVATAQNVGQPRTFTVPFHSVNGMVLLDATVNGKPAVLLLDTGADATILSPQASGPQRNENGD